MVVGCVDLAPSEYCYEYHWPRKGQPERGSTKSCRKAAEKSEFRGSLARKCAAFGEYPVVTPFPLPLSGPVKCTC